MNQSFVIREAVPEMVRIGCDRNLQWSDLLAPLDWMTNNCPRRWLVNRTKEGIYDWHENTGVPGKGI